MKTINIPAESIKVFGNVHRFFLENPVEDFSKTKAVLTGNFTSDIFSILCSYMQEKAVRFSSITFSPDLSFPPLGNDYQIGDSYEFPEGITVIKNFSFIKHHFKSVTFPSTLQKIEETAFLDCTITDEIILPEESLYFTQKDGVLRNRFNGQILLSTKAACSKRKIKWTEEQISLWNEVSVTNKPHIIQCQFWKEKFSAFQKENNHDSMIVNPQMESGEKLRLLLVSLPDTFGNILPFPTRNMAHDFFPYLINLQILTEGVQQNYYPGQTSNFSSLYASVAKVYCYSSNFLAPSKVHFLFVSIANGFELIIPQFHFYHFFDSENLHLIPVWINHLQENLFEYLQEMTSKVCGDFDYENNMEETPPLLTNSTFNISQTSRRKVLEALSQKTSETDVEKINSSINRIHLMASRFNCDVFSSWSENHEINLHIQKKGSSDNLCFCLEPSQLLDFSPELLEKLRVEIESAF